MRSFEEVSREGLVEIIKEGEQIIVLQSNTIARLEADKARLVEALRGIIELDGFNQLHRDPLDTDVYFETARALLAEMEKSND